MKIKCNVKKSPAYVAYFIIFSLNISEGKDIKDDVSRFVNERHLTAIGFKISKQVTAGEQLIHVGEIWAMSASGFYALSTDLDIAHSTILIDFYQLSNV